MRAHGLVEHRAAIAPFRLGPVHRGVCVAQQFFAETIARLPERDADARRRKQLAAAEPQRLADRHQDVRGQRFALLHMRKRIDQDRELVAAEARDYPAIPEHVADATTDLDQHLVASGVTDAVVDQLESVEIEEQDRERRAFAFARGADRAIQAFEQLRAIRQSGQGIVSRLVGQPLLGAHAFADLGA